MAGNEQTLEILRKIARRNKKDRETIEEMTDETVEVFGSSGEFRSELDAWRTKEDDVGFLIKAGMELL